MPAIQTQPYNVARLITKSDTVNLPTNLNGGVCDAIYVGGAGIVVAVLPDDTTAAFTCVAGQTVPIRAKRVNSTTTTATLMNALYIV
jgi:hypothetical protein